MTRREAIQRILERTQPIEPGQKDEIDLLRSEDAWGLARLFYEVYGDSYPQDAYYVPELLLAEIASGRLHCVVARAENGDIVGHMGMFSFAPFAQLYEIGVGLVAPSYRIFSNLALRLGDFITNELTSRIPLQALFSEAVCAHKTIQKLALRMGHAPVGLELDLISGGHYSATDQDRTSCLLTFKSFKDYGRRIHIPDAYERHARFVYEALPLRREFAPAVETAPDGKSRCMETLSEGAGLARCSVLSLAQDFGACLMDFEDRTRDYAVRQIYLNLDEPQAGLGAKLLREHGYFFCGFLPRWFDGDALIMQKLAAPTNYVSIKLVEKRAKRILELVREDRRQ
jgi:hypothetical protein